MQACSILGNIYIESCMHRPGPFMFWHKWSGRNIYVVISGPPDHLCRDRSMCLQLTEALSKLQVYTCDMYQSE